MRGWRNWYTRTFEGRVPQGLRVQLPPRALYKNMHYVYVLRSIKNQRRYVGSTGLLPEERCREHNAGASRWTKGNRPFVLMYQESYSTNTEARKRENFLKSGVGRKFLDSLLNHERVSAEGGSASG